MWNYSTLKRVSLNWVVMFDISKNIQSPAQEGRAFQQVTRTPPESESESLGGNASLKCWYFLYTHMNISVLIYSESQIIQL